ncbi:MAG: iron ABC transporter permease [Bacteroidales bacterium]|nr:iron ABC transporter permease [Bacteroidales bacterium]
MQKTKTYGIALTLLVVLLAGSCLLFGSADIPCSEVIGILAGRTPTNESWAFIVLQSRLPQTLTALLCGASLSVAGLMLQTVFNNPLADPSILGISSGANLGVAFVLLAGGGMTSFVTTLSAAFVGAMLVLGVILLLSGFIKSNVMLLIAGIMIGYLISSAISLLNFLATSEGVHSFIIWGMGNFGGVDVERLPWYSVVCLVGLLMAVSMVKPLNALLLGQRYAENLGVNLRLTRSLLLLATGLLTAVTTAFCGPVSFIGLAVPHVARLLLGSSNHQVLMPITMLCGSAVALLCNLICMIPADGGMIPLNVVTPMFGAPVVLFVIMNQKKIQHFN